MEGNWVDQEGEHDTSQPRYARNEHVWKVAQDALYWFEIGRAQRVRLKFYQTRSNAIILHDTLPPACIERVVSKKIVKSCIQEFLNRHELFIQLPSKLIGKHIWTRTLRHQQEAGQCLINEYTKNEENDQASTGNPVL